MTKKIKFYNPIKKQEIIPKKVKEEDVIGYYLEKAYGVYEIENPKEYFIPEDGDPAVKVYYCAEPWIGGLLVYELDDGDISFEDRQGVECVYWDDIKIGEPAKFKETNISVRKDVGDAVTVMCPWGETNEEFVNRILGGTFKVYVHLRTYRKALIEKEAEEFKKEIPDAFVKRLKESEYYREHLDFRGIFNADKKDIEFYDFNGVYLIAIKKKEYYYVALFNDKEGQDKEGQEGRFECFASGRGFEKAWNVLDNERNTVAIYYDAPSLSKGVEYFHITIFKQ